MHPALRRTGLLAERQLDLPASYRLRPVERSRHPHRRHFGTQLRGLHARYLRFEITVTRVLPYDLARLASGVAVSVVAGGIHTPGRAPNFQVCYMPTSPARLVLAHSTFRFAAVNLEVLVKVIVEDNVNLGYPSNAAACCYRLDVIAARSATQVTFASPRTSTWSMPWCARRWACINSHAPVEPPGFLGLHALAPHHDRRVVFDLRTTLPRPFGTAITPVGASALRRAASASGIRRPSGTPATKSNSGTSFRPLDRHLFGRGARRRAPQSADPLNRQT